MPISWTKEWSGSDDGTLIKGIDFRNLQDDLADVLTKSDLGDSGLSVTHDGSVLVYEGDVLYI